MESDDVLIAGSGVVAIHASTEGEKRLTIPAEHTVKDAMTGAALPQGGNSGLNLKKGETKLLSAASIYEK